MKRFCLFLTFLMLFCSFGTFSVEAHPKAEEHYEEMEAMLFDSRKYQNTSDEDEKEAILTLEYASTLCIDEYGNKNVKKLTDLKEWGVPGLPLKLSEINPPKDSLIKLGPSNHRTYTHQGWKHSYINEEGGDLAQWETRKNILLSSAEEVFDFSMVSGKWLFIDFGYSAKCDSLCALIYYNHLVGDYLEDTDPVEGNVNKFNRRNNGKKIPFASNASKPVDIFSELEKHLSILFKDQSSTRTYDSLMSDIKTLAKKARKLAGNKEGTITEDELPEMRTYVVELMDILTGEDKSGKKHSNAIHKLLEKEKFFTKVFKP